MCYETGYEPLAMANLGVGGAPLVGAILRCRGYLPGAGWSLRPRAKLKSRHRPETTPADRVVEVPDPAILCRQCQHPITSPDQRRIVDNAHVHTFANPSGIIFEIACYGEASGCGYIGPASSEFVWFAGYQWRIAVCAACLIHLGWRFGAADGRYFHGLITSRLILPGT